MIAESYERIHRSNLVGMGVVPLEFLPGDTAQSLGLTGRERYSVLLPQQLAPRMLLQVQVGRGAAPGSWFLVPGTGSWCVTCPACAPTAGRRQVLPGQDALRHGRGADLLPPRRHPQLHDPQDDAKLGR